MVHASFHSFVFIIIKSHNFRSIKKQTTRILLIFILLTTIQYHSDLLLLAELFSNVKQDDKTKCLVRKRYYTVKTRVSDIPSLSYLFHCLLPIALFLILNFWMALSVVRVSNREVHILLLFHDDLVAAIYFIAFVIHLILMMNWWKLVLVSLWLYEGIHLLWKDFKFLKKCSCCVEAAFVYYIMLCNVIL